MKTNFRGSLQEQEHESARSSHGWSDVFSRTRHSYSSTQLHALRCSVETCAKEVRCGGWGRARRKSECHILPRGANCAMTSDAFFADQLRYMNAFDGQTRIQCLLVQDKPLPPRTCPGPRSRTTFRQALPAGTFEQSTRRPTPLLWWSWWRVQEGRGRGCLK